MTSRSDPRASPPELDEAVLPAGAVVTGVGMPVGGRIAQALAGLGYALHLTDPDDRVAARAAAELGAPAFGSALDVRSLPACRAAASRTRRRFGSLEVWINAATLTGAAPAWEVDERTRQRMLDVNLVGTMNGTLAALEVMRSTARGAVVNLIALDALLPRSGQSLYAAAQHGALAFSLGALADLQATGLRGVSVSCLCPSRRVVERGSGRLAAALAELLEDPRPVLAIPGWHGALTRARYLWASPLRPVGRSFARRTSR
jgi:NAD(P)-dependent dehydrogenase (short-subunit alcohol dehydrogenase family)